MQKLMQLLVIMLLGFICMNAEATATASVSGFVESSNNLIKTVSYRLKLPSLRGDRYFLTIYSDGQSRVFHFQSKSDEFLINGDSGKLWEGNLEDLLRNYQRIDTMNPQKIGQNGEPASLLEHFHSSGCLKHNYLCTALADADFVVYASQDSSHTEFTFELHDYSRLFAHVQSVFSGDKPIDAGVFSQREAIAALDYAGRYSWHDRYKDALRSLKNNTENLQRFAQGVGKISLPFIGKETTLSQQSGRITFDPSNINHNIDVGRELEIAACSIRAANAAKSLLGVASTRENEVKAMVIDCANYNVFVTAAFLDASGAEARKLASALRKQINSSTTANERDELNLYACELEGKGGCALKQSSFSHAPKTVVKRAPPQRDGKTIDVTLNQTDASNFSTNASEELVKINKIGNKMLLLGFDEVGVGLKRDAGDIGGLIFIARPVENATKGVFKVDVFQNPRSPVKFSQGAYRISVKFAIDTQREDQCSKDLLKDLLCKFKIPQVIPKRNLVVATFTLNENNQWRDTQTVSAGNLKPLQADGSTRYESTLKDVRLGVQQLISFNPN